MLGIRPDHGLQLKAVGNEAPALGARVRYIRIHPAHRCVENRNRNMRELLGQRLSRVPLRQDIAQTYSIDYRAPMQDIAGALKYGAAPLTGFRLSRIVRRSIRGTRGRWLRRG